MKCVKIPVLTHFRTKQGRVWHLTSSIRFINRVFRRRSACVRTEGTRVCVCGAPVEVITLAVMSETALGSGKVLGMLLHNCHMNLHTNKQLALKPEPGKILASDWLAELRAGMG